MRRSNLNLMSLSVVALAALGAGLSVRTARAAVSLVAYNFPGSPGSLAVSASDPHETTASIDLSGSTLSQAGIFGSGSIVFNTPAAATSEAAAVSNNSYFEFTIAPNAGYLNNFSSLTFNIFALGASTQAGFGVRSSVDGYASDISTAVVGQTSTPESISLSASQFQGVTAPVTFRIYNYQPSPTTTDVAYTPVSLNGSVVPVPEPASLALLGIPAAMVLLRRRSK